MWRYVLSKSLQIVVALWVVITLTFALMRLIPGDPFAQEQALPPEVHEALMRHYELDAPWPVQYGRYLKGVLTWNLGPSFSQKARTVESIIAQGFSVSALLGVSALLTAVALGTTLGTLGATYQNRWQDRLTSLIALFGISIPSFLLAALLQYTFAVKIQLLPVARWGTFSQAILPTLSLAALPTALIARLVRSSMLEVLRSEYITTARAKGLKEGAILLRHCLRNAVLPICTYLGPLTANILVGSFVVERIYGIPGLGQWFVTAVTNRDYTVIMGMTVFYAAILLACTLAVDVLYALIDPRIPLKRQTT